MRMIKIKIKSLFFSGSRLSLFLTKNSHDSSLCEILHNIIVLLLLFLVYATVDSFKIFLKYSFYSFAILFVFLKKKIKFFLKSWILLLFLFLFIFNITHTHNKTHEHSANTTAYICTMFVCVCTISTYVNVF